MKGEGGSDVVQKLYRVKAESYMVKVHNPVCTMCYSSVEYEHWPSSGDDGGGGDSGE